MVNEHDIVVKTVYCSNNFFINTIYVYDKRIMYKKLNFTVKILQHIIKMKFIL